MELASALLSPYVAVYLLVVAAVQAWVAYRIRAKRRRIAENRRAQGLPPHVLMGRAQPLAELRGEALLEATVLLATVILLPFILKAIGGTDIGPGGSGLGIVFAVLLLWLLWIGTDLARAFLAGLALQSFLAINAPVRVGDRVRLAQHSGTLVEIGTFFVRLETPDGELVCIPTRVLWSEVLISASVAGRACPCVMQFYLAPSVTREQCQAVEDTIVESIRASLYFAPSAPARVHLAQQATAIRLTAEACVASAENERLLRSEVTRAVLEFVSSRGIALASADVPADQPPLMRS